MAEATAQPLTFTLTHYRKQKHTHEAFIKWIVEDHLPLAIPIFKKHGVLGYSLFVTPPPLNASLAESMKEIRPTWDFADYDCIIEYTLVDASVIGKVMSDSEWISGAVKDEPEYVESTKALLSIGHKTPYLLPTGEVMNVKGY